MQSIFPTTVKHYTCTPTYGISYFQLLVLGIQLFLQDINHLCSSQHDFLLFMELLFQSLQ